jgi:hypothetical protein
MPGEGAALTFESFLPIEDSVGGVGACFCNGEPCAIGCGAIQRTTCISWMRQPRASVCAAQCLLLDQCDAFEFEDHLNETWCHLFSARPNESKTVQEDGRVFSGKYCFVRGTGTPVPQDTKPPTASPSIVPSTGEPSWLPSARLITPSSLPVLLPSLLPSIDPLSGTSSDRNSACSA